VVDEHHGVVKQELATLHLTQEGWRGGVLFQLQEVGAPGPGAPTSGNTIGAPGPDQQFELNLLFIQQIQSGKLALDNRGEGSLVLDGVGKHTIWFTDRPGRSAGQVRCAKATVIQCVYQY
jgi:hypothetical protein